MKTKQLLLTGALALAIVLAPLATNAKVATQINKVDPSTTTLKGKTLKKSKIKIFINNKLYKSKKIPKSGKFNVKIKKCKVGTKIKIKTYIKKKGSKKYSKLYNTKTITVRKKATTKPSEPTPLVPLPNITYSVIKSGNTYTIKASNGVTRTFKNVPEEYIIDTTGRTDLRTSSSTTYTQSAKEKETMKKILNPKYGDVILNKDWVDPPCYSKYWLCVSYTHTDAMKYNGSIIWGIQYYFVTDITLSKLYEDAYMSGAINPGKILNLTPPRQPKSVNDSYTYPANSYFYVYLKK